MTILNLITQLNALKELGDRDYIQFDLKKTSARQKVIVESAIDLLGDYIVLAHAKDRLADGHFAVAGKGVIDFPHYITALRRANNECEDGARL